jgi:AcrR family transcriptional regulator
MENLSTSLATTVAVITAMGAFGTAAFGLVDATKAFWGGVSNVGFGSVLKALTPFAEALDGGSALWRDTLRANWINGVAKEDQKTAAKTLIRLGLPSADMTKLGALANLSPAALQTAMNNIKAGTSLTLADTQTFGQLNAVIDAAMDAGFERGDQAYRNACKLAAMIMAVGLAVWAGWLVRGVPTLPAWLEAKGPYLQSHLLLWSIFVGVASVPIAPIAKDLASSLQAAAAAVTSVKT